jgi:hypothetical protein
MRRTLLAVLASLALSPVFAQDQPPAGAGHYEVSVWQNGTLVSNGTLNVPESGTGSLDSLTHHTYPASHGQTSQGNPETAQTNGLSMGDQAAVFDGPALEIRDGTVKDGLHVTARAVGAGIELELDRTELVAIRTVTSGDATLGVPETHSVSFRQIVTLAPGQSVSLYSSRKPAPAHFFPGKTPDTTDTITLTRLDKPARPLASPDSKVADNGHYRVTFERNNTLLTAQEVRMTPEQTTPVQVSREVGYVKDATRQKDGTVTLTPGVAFEGLNLELTIDQSHEGKTGVKYAFDLSALAGLNTVTRSDGLVVQKPVFSPTFEGRGLMALGMGETRTVPFENGLRLSITHLD